MIPLRVYLKNFLCHHEQEFQFDGHPVWLLHGPNGVGKSAVFDAMVYALFGEHNRREGVPNAVGDLIRYGESSMRVEFDFEYREHRYRVWRTRSRTGQPKQGVYALNGNSEPRPLRDVNSVRDLEVWVKQTLGLEYGQFVSAVLLRQGAAERLIDAKRDSRRDLFRGIIDLDPYIKLHNGITTARTEVNGVARSLRARIGTMPEVTEEQVNAAILVRDNSLTAWQRSNELEDAARQRLEQSRNWERLNQTRLGLQEHLDAASGRAKRADDLEKSVSRLRELRLVVPALIRIAELAGEANAAQTTFNALNQSYQSAVSRQAELIAAADQERQKTALHHDRVNELDRQIAGTTAECKRLLSEVEQAKQVADLHRQLNEARAKEFEPDLDARLARSEEAVIQAQSARDAYPHLEAIFQSRAIYNQATSEAHNATTTEAAVTRELVQIANALAEARHETEIALERCQTARQANAVAQDHLAQASHRLTRFCTVAGAAVCSECGQAINAEHADRERERLQHAAQDAEQALHNCHQELRRATSALEVAQQLATQRESERLAAENSRNEATRNNRDAGGRASSARVAFENARMELTEDLACRVNQIESSDYPTQEHVSQVRSTGRQLQAKIQSRDEVRNRCRERDRNAELVQTLTQAVRTLGAPSDMAVVKEQQVQCERQLDELNRNRITEEEKRKDAELSEQTILGELRQTADRLIHLSSSLGGAQNQLENAQKAHKEAVATIPEGAAAWEPDELAIELQRLESAQVEREFEALANDRTLRGEWQRNLADTERQIEEQVPSDARRPTGEVQSQLEEEQRRTLEADRERQIAQQQWMTLTNQRVERNKAQQELISAERNHTLHNRLAELLGSEGIQLFLLRNAERRIIELANEVLNRVSRGELRFEPPDPPSCPHSCGEKT